MKKSTIIDSAQNLQMTLSVKHVVPSQNEYMLVDGVSDENSIVSIKFTIDQRLNQGCVEILCQEVYHFTPDVTLTENDYAILLRETASGGAIEDVDLHGQISDPSFKSSGKWDAWLIHEAETGYVITFDLYDITNQSLIEAHQAKGTRALIIDPELDATYGMSGISEYSDQLSELVHVTRNTVDKPNLHFDLDLTISPA